MLRFNPSMSDMRTALRSYSNAFCRRVYSKSAPLGNARTCGLSMPSAVYNAILATTADSPIFGGVHGAALRIFLDLRRREAVGQGGILYA